MADLADKSGSVYSNIVNNNDDSVTYTIPNTPTLSVESVVATVDNSAAGSAATLTITIQDQDGQVIAQKAMPATIPAGDTGVGTFALGLDDPSEPGIRFGVDNFGDWLHIYTNHAFGIILEDDGGGGILLYAEGNIRLDSNTQNTFISATVFDFEAVTVQGSADTWQYDVDSGGIAWSSDGEVSYSLNGGTGKFTVILGAGSWLEVQDRSLNPIFRVNEDGSLQGKTGKALTFNL